MISRGGGEEHQRAFVLLAKMGDGRTADIVGAVQMYIDNGIPILVLHLVEHGIAQDAGRADDRVQAFE